MKKQFFFFVNALLCALSSFSQITIAGNGSAITTPVNAAAIAVDNSISITSSLSITDARVKVSSNFNTGDVLSYTASLPAGVTASYNSSTGILSFTGTATAAQYQTLFQSVKFATSSTVATQRTITFELGDANIKYNSANNHYYLFVSGSYTWASAKTEAELASRKFFGLQGYLATVTTTPENTFVNALPGKGWLGGSDDYNYINSATGASTYANQGASEGKWYWVTGPEKGTLFSNGGTANGGAYTNWNAGEPNNSGTTEHYLENAYAAGKWNDANGITTSGFVIEYGGVAGDPSVTAVFSRPVNLIATSLRSTGTNNGYALHATSIGVDNALTVLSASNITNATVTVSSGFKPGDQLSFTSASLPAGVSGSYNATTGVLSFIGSSASYSAWQALLRTVSFSSTSNVIGNRIISFSVGNLTSASNGHFYEFVTPAVAWYTAKANASGRTYLGLTGYLATITSQTENDFIKQTLSADGWIGASDDYGEINTATGATTYANQGASEGKWYWVTGPEKGTQMTTGNAPNASSYPTAYGTSFNNWNIGEPNNFWDGTQYENVAEIYSSGGNLGKWNDNRSNITRGYVVEYGGLSTDPLLELSASKTIVITSILPANDLKFAVAKNGLNAKLKWSTASEKNTLRFDVMHSLNGKDFNKIGELAAIKNSSITTSYSFVHTLPGKGSNYYQLKLVDEDGRTSFSETRQLNFEKISFTVSPNPVKNSFAVSNPFDSKAVLIIKNAGGAVVLKKEISSYQTIVDATNLAAGIYFATMVKDERQSDVVKFVKE